MINMVPPMLKPTDFSGILPKKYLRLQNTGDLFFMDNEDWEKAKHILWWWKDGQPVTRQGLSFAEYVGIKANRLTDGIDIYDFRRTTYA